MAGVDIKLNNAGMRELLQSAGVRAPVREAAEKVAGRARAGATVESGAYRDGITVVSDTTDRAVERVTSTASHAAIVEARTGNLKRALGR